MHYVKQFDINGVATRQVACIELHGKPNAATEGAVGVLGIDMDSPLHDVYKCVAVNGSIYTWELLSSGLSIMSATISGGGVEAVQFPYTNLLTPAMYVVKVGDLIIDIEGYLYQISALNTTYVEATYCGTRIAGKPGEPGEPGEKGDPGVHVGSSTPPDSANIWIYTAGDDLGSIEEWEFTLEDGSTVTKTVIVPSDNALVGLRIKQPDGTWSEIPALRGGKGEPGASGV